MIVKLFSAHKDKSFSDISTIFPTPFPTHPLVFSQITPKGAWEEGEKLANCLLDVLSLQSDSRTERSLEDCKSSGTQGNEEKAFTLHLSARNAHKQGVWRGEGLATTLHPPFTTLHPRQRKRARRKIYAHIPNP